MPSKVPTCPVQGRWFFEVARVPPLRKCTLKEKPRAASFVISILGTFGASATAATACQGVSVGLSNEETLPDSQAFQPAAGAPFQCC